MEVISRQDKKDPRSIPVGWEVRRLGSLGSFLKGSGVKKNDANSGDIPCIRYGEIYTHNHDYIRSFNSRISSDIASTATRIKKGDLLFAGSGETKDEIGKCVAYLDNQEAFAGGDIVILRLTEANPMFMGYYCNTAPINAQKASKGQGDAVVHISASALSSIEVILPPAGEQLAIATTLSDVDALIAGLEKLIAKKRDIKQAAMQQLLTGQTRLPGFSGKWEVKRLGELGAFLKGSGVRKDEAKSGELPCVRYGEIYTHHDDYIRSFNSWISRDVADTAMPLRRGDLLFAGSGETKGEIGKCVSFVDDIEAYAGGDIVVLRQIGQDSLFLGYLLNTPAIASQKAGLGQGDAVVHISASALASIKVSLPNPKEQTAIAVTLSDMDAELVTIKARLAKTRAIKQGMMQELLTGRTRLV